MKASRILALRIAADVNAPMLSLPIAHLVPGRGIEGDRYYYGLGSISTARTAHSECWSGEQVNTAVRLMQAWRVSFANEPKVSVDDLSERGGVWEHGSQSFRSLSGPARLLASTCFS